MEEEQRALWTALEATRGEGGAAREFEVTVIRPGTSSNGLRYGERALAESVELWNGAASFCDHPGPLDQGRAGGRSVRDLVGVFAAARHEPGRGIVARLRLYPNAEWLARMVDAHLEDVAAGRPAARLGISADMVVIKEATPGESGGRGIQEVRRIVAVNSADVVMNPSAGGQFERILEGGEGEKVAASEEAMEGIDSATKETVVALRAELARDRFEGRLARSGLPEAGQAFVRAQVGEAAEAAEVDRAIESVRGLLASAGGSPVRGMGQQRGAVHLVTPRERVQVALDRLFGIAPPDHLSDVPRLTGIREAYIAVTGDRFFDGRYHFESSVLEANEVTTTVMADVLLDSMTKRLVRDYQGQRRWWESISVRVPVSNMLAQNRILLADFASLSSVSENGAYANLAWADTKETYTPAKVGNLVYVTLEMILNDNVRAVTHIPHKLAVAATVTINELVSGLFTAQSGEGSDMTDTYHTFESAHHGNKGTTALSSSTLQTAMIAMAKQTNTASKVLGIRGKYLLVPPDLMYTAAVLAGTDRDIGTAYNNINPLYGQVEPVVVPNWSDTNNWYLMADPAEIECIEVGFLNGREEPELLLQDQGTAGTVFTNDAISYKVRHIYGAGWLDYRGAYGAVVA